jgi:iron only hydrogenase large subunit-like protein
MNIIVTSEAKCRDCYKCVRHCPVKAIAVKNSQACVVEEECIFCGRCINICPQKAKTSISQVQAFDAFLKSNSKVVVSLAPSYLAATSYSTPWKLVSALMKVGVSHIEETAIAAEAIAKGYNRLLTQGVNRPLISSCCPTIVNLIQKYIPELIGSLADMASPMILHAQSLKAELGDDIKVVFIGPCVAKKVEAEGPVDAVLTFEETMEYFVSRGLDPETLEDAYPHRISYGARTYPLEHGILRAAGMDDTLNGDKIVISGIEECMETFRDIQRGLLSPRFIEAFGCEGGCIGGPGMANSLGVSAREQRLLEHSKVLKALQGSEENSKIKVPVAPASKRFAGRPGKKMPSEEEIREILALTGKFSIEDEKNCGGCGYSTCREKAIAVYHGMAESEMCVSYMREKAESFSNLVVDTSLEGVIVVDKDMIIQGFNRAADRMFNRRKVTPKGKHLSEFIDPEDFQKVWETQATKVNFRKCYEDYSLITRQTIYPLPKYGVIIGLITDITAEEMKEQEIEEISRQALSRASDVIREQMKVAQDIAGLLGESTASTKATLLELMEIMEKRVVDK